MGVGEPVAEVLVVIFGVRVVHLQPSTRNVDRVDVRRKAPMRLVDVVANVGSAVDDVAALLALLTTAHGEPLTEQQARIKAAQWVRGPMFGADRSASGPAADKSLAEVLSHIRESLLAVRGDTRYCGVIREPTWILIWDSEEAAAWYGGYPVMINARTGKVLDCRS
jgi:hypothetical protein